MSAARIDVVQLERCSSTQDEVAERLTSGAARIVAVAAQRQSAGRGRNARRWEHDPAHGDALLLSIGIRAPLHPRALEGLPLRVAQLVRRELARAGGLPLERIAWKAPNDLLDARNGAKLAGILVDAQTVGAEVRWIIVGIGANVRGAPFVTSDGRDATTLTALGGTPAVDELPALRQRIADGVAALLR